MALALMIAPQCKSPSVGTFNMRSICAAFEDGRLRTGSKANNFLMPGPGPLVVSRRAHALKFHK